MRNEINTVFVSFTATYLVNIEELANKFALGIAGI
jgi:hypothetical protein